MQKLKKPKLFETAFSTYEATHILGQGGSGVIFRARDQDQLECAIKSLDPERATKDKKKRFRNEINFCLRNSHPNVLTVTDFGTQLVEGRSNSFYVMERFDSSLRERISAGIPPDRVLKIFDMILTGVEAAHMHGVIHKDLKPENILVRDDETLVVADFGIAQFLEDDLFTAVETKDTARLANFVYAAPEQRKRGVCASQVSDIYALGLILNEMMTSEVPFGTEYRTIASAHPQFSYLDRLVADMLRQSQDDRLQDIRVVKSALIGHKNDFITLQRLDELTQTVVPEGDGDDPLISDPIQLVDFEWEPDTLTLKLSQAVNDTWIWAFQSMNYHESAYGYAPDGFRLRGNTAQVQVDEKNVQRIIDYFKPWLPIANQKYEERVQADLKKKDAETRRKMRERIEAEEAKQRVRKQVKL